MDKVLKMSFVAFWMCCYPVIDSTIRYSRKIATADYHSNEEFNDHEQNVAILKLHSHRQYQLTYIREKYLSILVIHQQLHHSKRIDILQPIAEQ